MGKKQKTKPKDSKLPEWKKKQRANIKKYKDLLVG